MQYLVLTGWKLTEFEQRIELYLNDGWKLQGGVSVTTSLANEITYAQALTKENV